MSDTKTSFLGIPVEGYITRGHRSRTEQWDAEKLGPLLQVVLDDPKVEYLTWMQYTPYFNDGDPCEFSVHDLMVKVVGIDEGGDYDDGRLYPSDPAVVGGRSTRWLRNPETSRGEWLEYGEPHEPLQSAAGIKALSDAWGHFENVFLDAFGDHAQVRVYKDHIEVDEYEHD